MDSHGIDMTNYYITKIMGLYFLIGLRVKFFMTVFNSTPKWAYVCPPHPKTPLVSTWWILLCFWVGSIGSQTKVGS